MNASHKSILTPYKYSNSVFYFGSECYLSFQKQQIMGMSFFGNSSKLICREDYQNPDYYHSKKIYNQTVKSSVVVFYEKFNTVFFIQNGKKMTQMDFTTGRIIKKYPNLGISRINCYAWIGHFVFFGGSSFLVNVFLIDKGIFFQRFLETSIAIILALRLCVVDNKQDHKKKKVYLVASGIFSNYKDDKTDIFDVTEFLVSLDVPVVDGDFEEDEIGNLDW